MTNKTKGIALVGIGVIAITLVASGLITPIGQVAHAQKVGGGDGGNNLNTSPLPPGLITSPLPPGQIGQPSQGGQIGSGSGSGGGSSGGSGSAAG